MAQAKIEILVDVKEIVAARRQVKRIIADAGEANRMLARLEERVAGLTGELAAHGIRLEIEED